MAGRKHTYSQSHRVGITFISTVKSMFGPVITHRHSNIINKWHFAIHIDVVYTRIIVLTIVMYNSWNN